MELGITAAIICAALIVCVDLRGIRNALQQRLDDEREGVADDRRHHGRKP